MKYDLDVFVTFTNMYYSLHVNKLVLFVFSIALK